MAFTPPRDILKPRSRRSALHSFPAFTAKHAFTAQVDFGDTSNTPSPATPELEWAETPPATEEPRTPGTGFEVDHGVISPHSPLALRKPGLQTKDIPALNLSQADLDVPGHLLSETSSKTRRSERTFQEKLSGVIINATSQQRPPPSDENLRAAPNPPLQTTVKEQSSLETVSQALCRSSSATRCSSDAIRKDAPAEKDPVLANSIKTEEQLVLFDKVNVTCLQTESTATMSTIAPSQDLRSTRPLTLSIVWELNTKLSTVLPLEAVESLETDHEHCICTTKAGSRCTNSIKQTYNPQFVTELSKALLLLKSSLDFGRFAEHMAPMIDSATCTQVHRKISRKSLDELCSYSWKSREIASGKAHQIKAISNSVESTFGLWISALLPASAERKDTDVPAKRDDDAVHGALFSTLDVSSAATEGTSVPCRSASPKSTVMFSPGNIHAADKKRNGSSGTAHRTTTAEPVLLSTHLNHRFVKFRYSKEKLNLAAQMLIRQTLLAPLTPADMYRDGFIYVFWHPGSFEHVKIGYSNDVKKRLQHWRTQCGFELEQHESTEFGGTRKVHHLHRVESLIHAELKDYRLLEPCCTGCGRRHLEWFKVPVTYAQKVVGKWTSRSFYSKGLLEDSIGEAEIEKLCELTVAQTDLTQPRPKKPTKGGRRSIGGQSHALRQRRGLMTETHAK